MELLFKDTCFLCVEDNESSDDTLQNLNPTMLQDPDDTGLLTWLVPKVLILVSGAAVTTKAKKVMRPVDIQYLPSYAAACPVEGHQLLKPGLPN